MTGEESETQSEGPTACKGQVGIVGSTPVLFPQPHVTRQEELGLEKTEGRTTG